MDRDQKENIIRNNKISKRRSLKKRKESTERHRRIPNDILDEPQRYNGGQTKRSPQLCATKQDSNLTRSPTSSPRASPKNEPYPKDPPFFSGQSKCPKTPFPNTNFKVLYEEPHFLVEDKVWWDRTLLDEEKLQASVASGDPTGQENPTLIFLLGPKACGKTTFLRKHKSLLQDELNLDESHCHVDYEFLRKNHKGYKTLVERGLEKKVVYAKASKKLKREFVNWKLQTAFDCAKNRFDLIVTDNRGKKLFAIVEELGDYSVHVVFMFISFRTCLERQVKRAKEEGRSIKPLKYCKLMHKLQKVFQRTRGTIIIVDNENFECTIEGMFENSEVDKALDCVYRLHEKYNNFDFSLFHQENWVTIREKFVPENLRPFA